MDGLLIFNWFSFELKTVPKSEYCLFLIFGLLLLNELTLHG
jgi:hypothetical protein